MIISKSNLTYSRKFFHTWAATVSIPFSLPVFSVHYKADTWRIVRFNNSFR